MKFWKRRLDAASIAALLAIVVGATVHLGCTSSAGGPSDTKGAGRLTIVNRINITDAQLAQLPGDFVAKAARFGWSRVSGGFIKEGHPANVEVTDGKTVVHTDANGYFQFSRTTPLSAVTMVGGERSLTQKATTRSLTREWSVQIPFGCKCTGGTDHHAEGSASGGKCCTGTGTCCDKSGISRAPSPPGTASPSSTATPAASPSPSPTAGPMEENEEEENEGNGGEEGEEGEGHQPGPSSGCQDYNGPLGDGKNWPPTSFQGMINFVGSDCDQAFFLGECWKDFQAGQSCVGRLGAGACSKLIGKWNVPTATPAATAAP